MCFSRVTIKHIHTYIPISCYLCSICRSDCLQVIQTSSCHSKSLIHGTSSYKKMATAKQILLSEECQAFIADCLKNTSTVTPKPSEKPDQNVHITVDLDSNISSGQWKSQPNATQWIMIGHTVLYESDRAVLLNEEGWINDNHVASAQILLKGGLDFTLKQETKSLKPLLPNSLQVIHVDGNHWAAASTVNCKREDIMIYDSLYCSVNCKTKHLLARLVHTSKPVFLVRVANVTKQSGTSACGLFAIAYITDIAFGRNPEHHVFKQSEMRGHLYKFF